MVLPPVASPVERGGEPSYSVMVQSKQRPAGSGNDDGCIGFPTISNVTVTIRG
jgi:hypothetical protein